MNLIIFSLLIVICLALIPFEVKETITHNSNVYGWSKQEVQLFNDWTEKYQKRYENQFSVIYRMNMFVHNHERVKEHNSNLPDDKWGLNIFSDQSDEELAERIFMKVSNLPQEEEWEFYNEDDINEINEFDGIGGFLELSSNSQKTIRIPSSKSWKSKMTKPEQQGMCGSCWAFATLDTAISRLAIKKQEKLGSLSKSQLMDCMQSGNGGCFGGSIGTVFRHIHKYGAFYKDDYRPYDETQQQCEDLHGYVGYGQMKSQKSYKNPSNTNILIGLQSGPVTALMYVGESWFRYESGVIDTCSYTDKQYVHAVSIYGYNSKYWYFKNSWGTEWGRSGYGTILRKGKEYCIDKISRVTYPIINK